MKNTKWMSAAVFALCLTLGGCQNKEPDQVQVPIRIEDNAEAESVEKTTESEEATKEDPIATAIAMEENSAKEAAEEIEAIDESLENQEGEEQTPEALATVGYRLPIEYITPCKGEGGTLEYITYMANDYLGDGESVEKNAYVYLPAGYDETKQYNVLYLMHGIGGSEKEWGFDQNDKSKLKRILDNLFERGDSEPFIVVTPNGRALAMVPDDATKSFYSFGEELKKDLIPYIEGHYATYADYDENGYDLSATRTHRAMAGLSMGGMQTINIGICESLDTFSWFGAFSAAPTSYEAVKVAKYIDESEYDVDFFYNICGTEDNIAYGAASAAAKNLDSCSEKMEAGTNFMWQEKNGGHDFNIWFLGMYNFAQIVFGGDYTVEEPIQ